MPYLTNGWVGYLSRSAQQIMDSLLNRLAGKVPEMTDHSPSNPYVRNLEQMAGMHEQLGYYVDNAAREAFIVSARLYKSLIQKAREKDYQVIGNRPYTVNVRFTTTLVRGSDVVIPAGTVVSNADGSIPYRTLAAATILAGQTVSNIVSSSQVQKVTGVAVATSTGTSNYEVVFDEKIAHNSIQAYWNAVAWASKPTLAYSAPVDTHYVQTVNEDGKVVIYFGNANPFGFIPVSGQALTADYDLTLGKDGYVEVGDVNKIVTVALSTLIANTLSVVNLDNASGGADVETIEELRANIPRANKTLQRAVTLDDFEDLVSIAPGVSSAGAVYDGRRTINIYIVPTGGGIASLGLISATQTYINALKVVGTNPVIYSAGVIKQELVVEVEALANYANADVLATVQTGLLDFMSYAKQKVRGTIHLSDLYQVIENLPGVSSSNITVFAFHPYARPLNGTTPPLVWTTTPQAGSTTTQAWKIQFTSGTNFRLIKGSTLVGTFATGATVTTPELVFVIPAGVYSNGNTYEFYTYPYNASKVIITEPSIPNSQLADITLTVTGGY